MTGIQLQLNLQWRNRPQLCSEKAAVRYLYLQIFTFAQIYSSECIQAA